jgi:uncharacterized protein YciI
MKIPPRLLIIALALLSSVFAQPAAPSAVPVNREFDFWVGDWEVTDPQGTVLGWSRIVALPGGRVLHETWNDSKGAGGNGWLAFNPGTGEWNYSYASRAGDYAGLSGGRIGARLVLSGTSNRQAGPVRHLRIAWTPDPEGPVRQTVEVSDDGATWNSAFDGIYRKLGEGQGLFVIVRKRSAGWVAEKQLLDQPDYAGHIAFVRKYFRQGAIRHIGQLGAEGTHFQYIVRAADADAARRLIGEDPWDKTKIVEIEAVRPYTPFFGQP